MIQSYCWVGIANSHYFQHEQNASSRVAQIFSLDFVSACESLRRLSVSQLNVHYFYWKTFAVSTYQTIAINAVNAIMFYPIYPSLTRHHRPVNTELVILLSAKASVAQLAEPRARFERSWVRFPAEWLKVAFLAIGAGWVLTLKISRYSRFSSIWIISLTYCHCCLMQWS